MIESVKFLEENGYLYLKDFVDKESCRLMAESVNAEVVSGRGIKDKQCPLSTSFYGAFDRAQRELLPLLEDLSGKKLLEANNYIRFYVPGEILNKHIDREGCEYSITLTLGFEGEPWPFYIEDSFGKEKEIFMSVGDAIFYKGRERPHWRKKYIEGKWQVQAFFHYVDADGEFKYFAGYEKFKQKHINELRNKKT